MGTTKQETTNLRLTGRTAYQIKAVEAYLPEAETSKTTITFDTPDPAKALEQVTEAIHRAQTAGAWKGDNQALHSIKRAVVKVLEAKTQTDEEAHPEPTDPRPTAAEAKAHKAAKARTEKALLAAVQGDTAELEAIADEVAPKAKPAKKATKAKAALAKLDAAIATEAALLDQAKAPAEPVVIPAVDQGSVKDGAKVTFELSGSMTAALAKAGLIPAVELEAKGRGQVGTVTLKAATATELAGHLATTEVPGLPARRAARVAKRIQSALDAKAAK